MKPSEKFQCYLCEEIATTHDHIPPKCFFPKKKDSKKDDYRRKLITVPACRTHNNLRSIDDEYAAVVIAMNSQNEVAFNIFESKWIDTLCRREAGLGKRIFATARDVKAIHKKNNVLIPYETLAIPYEMKRIRRVIESIARGLYYIESRCQEKWKDDCIIKSSKFLKGDLSYSQEAYFLDQINQWFIHCEKDQELDIAPRKGENTDVFYYQFLKYEGMNFIIRMVFYSDFTFLAFLNHRKNAPSPIIFPL